MKLKKPLISICIPTYNRCEYLQASIQAYIEDPEVIAGNVEIVVSDNASTDDTCAYMTKIVKEYSNIRYYRNEENILDKNCPLVLSKGEGILHWLRNDTLLPVSGALSYACELVRKYIQDKPVLFFDNMERQNLLLGENVYYKLDDFLLAGSYNITWIGGFTIWHDDCEELEKDTADCELHLWHVRKICDLLLKRKMGVISHYKFAELQFVKRRNVAYGRFKVHYGYFFDIIKRFMDAGFIKQNTVDVLERDLLYGNLTNFMLEIDCNNDKHLLYDKDERHKLKELVYDTYKDKPYFNEFEKYYRKRRCVNKMIKIINWSKIKKYVPKRIVDIMIKPLLRKLVGERA